jgi:hypothetical protein
MFLVDSIYHHTRIKVVGKVNKTSVIAIATAVIKKSRKI